MQEIKGWIAKRSGATITITGTDENGEKATISGVTAVLVIDGEVIAERQAGNVILTVGED